MTGLIIGPLLRHVSDTTATVWVETDGPCDVEVLGRHAHTFHVAGHHYALVVIRDLTPRSTTEYDVRLDGVRCWPAPASAMPPSTIRTLAALDSTAHLGGGPALSDEDEPLRIVFGSCRTAAPHEPPWSLDLALDERGRGVDALYAHARRMITQDPTEWPHLMVFLGDQVYADDSSPKARERIAARRADRPPDERLPPELVDDFEEYTWLYQESWSSPWERWLLSVVPSVMIFDDHEMIDDWNISSTWVTDIRSERWWQEHVVGGLISYWIYQHLGNLHPDEIEAEGMLVALADADDGIELLREWAMRSEEFTPVPGGYRFSFWRDLGRVRLVMVDSRNGRVLTPGARAMVDDDEWDWIVDRCTADVDHLIIGTSLPAFTPGGIHDLQRWNEALVDRTAGTTRSRVARAGEWLRRAADAEDWPAFSRSFDALVDLLATLGKAERADAPASICVISGDIHFSYHSEVRFPGMAMGARVHQLVCSPIRNALTPPEKLGMRLVMSRPAGWIGRALRRTAGLTRSPVRWRIDHGPVWANTLGVLTLRGRHADVVVEQAKPDDEGQPVLASVLRATLTG